MFKNWKESEKTKNRQKVNNNKMAYKKAKRETRKPVYEARERARKKFCDQLLQEKIKGNMFRITKQIMRHNKDVVGGCYYVNDRDEKVAVVQNKGKDVWKDHFERLLNEEFSWER